MCWQEVGPVWLCITPGPKSFKYAWSGSSHDFHWKYKQKIQWNTEKPQAPKRTGLKSIVPFLTCLLCSLIPRRQLFRNGTSPSPHHDPKFRNFESDQILFAISMRRIIRIRTCAWMGSTPTYPSISFNPALSLQRQAFLLEELRKVKPKSILDIGCGEGLLLECLVRCDEALPIELLAGIDTSMTVLQRASRAIEASANEQQVEGRWRSLDISLLEGFILSYWVRA